MPKPEVADSASPAGSLRRWSALRLTMIVPIALGMMCRKMMRGGDAPIARAASTNSFSRSDRNSPRMSRASSVTDTRARRTRGRVSPWSTERVADDRRDDQQGIVINRSVVRMMTASAFPP